MVKRRRGRRRGEPRPGSAWKKNNRREIRRTFGRFLAILAIVALGVGFYSGLQITRDAMAHTGDEYVRDTALYDYRLVSTLGLTDEDVDAFLALDGVTAAEGSNSIDLLAEWPGVAERVLKAHALTERLNRPLLTAGRMPSAADECIGDNLLFSEADIGCEIGLTDGNESDALDQLTVRRFKLVGLCSSSAYMNLERGTSRLGDGTVAGFVYVSPKAFDVDYYSEVYVRLDVSGSAFSEDYDEAAEAYSDVLEDALSARADIRRQQIVDDAESELADGRAELSDAEQEYQQKRADAEAELADARTELDDASAQIADGEAKVARSERELSSGRREYSAGLSEYGSGESQYAEKKQQAEAEFASMQGQIDEQRAVAEAGMAQIEASGVVAQYDQLTASGAQIDAGMTALDGAQAQAEAKRQEAANGTEQLKGAQAQAQAELSKVQASIAALTADGEIARYESLVASRDARQKELDALSAQRAGLQQTISDADAALAELEGEIAAADQAVSDAEAALGASDIATARDNLAAARGKVDGLTGQIADVEARLSAAEPDSSEAAQLASQLEGLRADLESARAEAATIESSEPYQRGMTLEAQLEQRRSERSALAGQQGDWSQKKAQAEQALPGAQQSEAQAQSDVANFNADIDAILQTGVVAQYQALCDSESQLSQQCGALASQLEQANQGVSDADAALADIAQQRAGLEQQRAQVDAGLAQIEETGAVAQYQQLQQGIAQLDAAQAELDSARTSAQAELDASRQQLDAASKQLAAAKKQIQSGEAQLKSGKADLADARQKLADGQQEYDDAEAEAQQEFADAEAELDEARQELADAEQEIEDIPEASCFALGRGTNVGYASFETDTSVVEGLAKVFPLFFFLVAALVCSTTMTRMVDEQRTQIGTLKALGYSDGAIARKYIGYAGSAAVLGCVFGYFVGIHLFPYAVWQAYRLLYRFSDIRYLYDWRLLALSLAASLLCSVGATWAACRMELTQMPAGLMRPKAPKAGKRILLERIPPLWNRFGFLQKVSIRNILRYRKRLFMMILGIGGCTALVLTGFGIDDSVSHIAEDQYGAIFKYDFVFTFEDDQDEKAQRAFREEMGADLDRCVFVGSDSYDVTAGDGVRQATVVATGDMAITELVGLHRDGQPVAYPADGQVAINEKLAHSTGAGVGDAIEVKLDDTHAVHLTVGGIFENYAYNYIFMTDATYEQAFGESCAYRTAYASSPTGDVYAVSAKAAGLDGVLNVQVVADTKARVDNMLESMNSVVLLVIFCACSLAFVVLYNLSNINITERAREIATIKVLGFTRRETNSYVFRENVVLTLLGALAGLPAGVLLHRFVMDQIQLDSVAFQVRILPVSYGYALGITFGLTLAVNWILQRKIDRIDMADSLKSVE